MSTIKIKNDFGWESVASIKEPAPVLLKDVNFYDYDGTLVASYTSSEFLLRNTMPIQPSHKGLKKQGWNWSVTKAKDYVSKYGKLDIGATYTTYDEKTRFYISITDLHFNSLRIIFAVNGSVVVDWGDGSSTETVSGTNSAVSAGVSTNDHTYTSVGDYVISLDINGGLSFLTMGSTYNNMGTLMPPNSYGLDLKRGIWGMLTKLEIGKNVINIGENAFREFYNLKTVTISKDVKEVLHNAFRYCGSLKALILPSSINTGRPNAFDCHTINIIIYPGSLTDFRGDNTCVNDYCLKSFSIPESNTTIQSGELQNCYCIASLVIPSTVTVIKGNAFANTALHEIHFTSTAPPTVENSNAFSDLYSGCKIYVPTGYLSAYTGATNYPSSSTYTYLEE